MRRIAHMRPAAATLLLALASCSPAPAGTNDQAANTAQAAAVGDAPYDASLPMPELMTHVVQYSADGIWDRQGYVIDATGEHSLFPKNDEEWEKAESAARTLAEVTNTLLVPGRRIPEPEWDRAVASVRKLAAEAAAAAEKHDKQAFFHVGEKLDAACDECHKRYDPNFDPRYQH
ncbi:MAG: hypothetical protein J7500_09545 [Sphingomonas sp.]|uniref:hypothetical protein n=1 Tax=Sphingomonas sp. TaxID=28214 RepID=UPI001B1307C3|nr:hypothetical protein [Sphingomonas sp.]MBO9622942.1 hypothetical protein [Sphingomonas sp.]